ncbi:MAG TPA: tRNA 2-thiouridine(34) synthase MnmA [Syntrophomonadaceae bacterium]|nr:tRNA 2-thiouridine(34) synthase MnmA [Syntrophomonadaceae bacterium]HRX21441.1 tRNA 2-thiouridine(34) synthase MnmA [Syntrophomonadaceae bacterium]
MKVAVLLSGGVDSTVSALLLKEQGHEVIGLTMINFDESVAVKAKEAADSIGIKHSVIDLRQQFEDKVIKYFCNAYEKGNTPNPCVECNRFIKFGALLSAAQELGAEKVATGHYARVEYVDGRKRYLLRKGTDEKKDQSYFLYALKQEQLARTIFPLGEWTKENVRKKAVEAGLKVARERESQEICFAEDHMELLAGRVKFAPGDVVDMRGNVIGSHKGLPFYTVGQRKGLGISGGRPIYVIRIDEDSNQLIVDDEAYLFNRSLLAGPNNFIMAEKIPDKMRVMAKIRYRAQPAPATVSTDGDLVRVDFDQPQRAITAGQSVVFYQNDYVVGGGIIIKAM